MKRSILEDVEDHRVFQRHPQLPRSVPTDQDTDDYEAFDDGDMMNALWQQGEEQSEDELMRTEDDY